jgi:hypothetical protein
MDLLAGEVEHEEAVGQLAADPLALFERAGPARWKYADLGVAELHHRHFFPRPGVGDLLA